MLYTCKHCGCSAMMDEGKKLRCLNCGHTQPKATSSKSSSCTHTPIRPQPKASAVADDPYQRALPDDYGQHEPQTVTPPQPKAGHAAPPPPSSPTPAGNGAYTPPPYGMLQPRRRRGRVIVLVSVVLCVVAIAVGLLIAATETIEDRSTASTFPWEDLAPDTDEDYDYDYDYDYDDPGPDLTYYTQDPELPWLYADSTGWVVFSEADYVGDGTVVIPETVAGVDAVWLDTDAFRNCDTVTEVFLPETMETIGDEAFTDCDNLRTIHLPANVDFFFEDAIENCPALEQVIYPGTAQDWDDNVLACEPNDELLDALVFAGSKSPAL